jgi:hypothetical protein
LRLKEQTNKNNSLAVESQIEISRMAEKKRNEDKTAYPTKFDGPDMEDLDGLAEGLGAEKLSLAMRDPNKLWVGRFNRPTGDTKSGRDAKVVTWPINPFNLFIFLGSSLIYGNVKDNTPGCCQLCGNNLNQTGDPIIAAKLAADGGPDFCQLPTYTPERSGAARRESIDVDGLTEELLQNKFEESTRYLDGPITKSHNLEGFIMDAQRKSANGKMWQLKFMHRTGCQKLLTQIKRDKNSEKFSSNVLYQEMMAAINTVYQYLVTDDERSGKVLSAFYELDKSPNWKLVQVEEGKASYLLPNNMGGFGADMLKC